MSSIRLNIKSFRTSFPISAYIIEKFHRYEVLELATQFPDLSANRKKNVRELSFEIDYGVFMKDRVRLTSVLN